MKIPLIKSILLILVGKTISWESESGKGNSGYNGICIITDVDLESSRPIKSETISGDNLKFAFVDSHGLVSENNGKTYQLNKENEEDYCLSYSDSYREIFYEILENK